MLHEGLLLPGLLYGSETMINIEKERCLLGIRRMDRVPNAWIRELCGVAQGVQESVFRWFGHIERIKNDMIAKRVYVVEFVGSR